MTLKLAYLNKKKPIEKNKYEPNYKQESKRAWEDNQKSTKPIKLSEEEFRTQYEFYQKRFYQ